MLSFNQKLINNCKEKNNRLCIGLDIDKEKLRIKTISYMQSFIKDIIDATISKCPVYKINFAFYERLGEKGYQILSQITKYIDERAITIADANNHHI